MRWIVMTVLSAAMTALAGRETLNFNEGWRFARYGAMPDGTVQAEPQGLEMPEVNDAEWRELDLPHDWGIEGPFRAELENRTGKLPWAGIGWYRKSFDVPASDAGKNVFIDFDGAMSDSTVWLNGEYVGEWPYGYSSFRLELTKHLKPGARNVIAVRLDNKPESSRWYPGGGIYRNVRLVKTESVHVDHWGIFVTTPEVSAESATVNIKTTLSGAESRRDACDTKNCAAGVSPAPTVEHEVYEVDSDKVVAQGNGSDCSINVKSPKLWNLETPYLYTLKTTVKQNGKVVDTVETSFGIRSIQYTAAGFFLNGKKVRMNGVCQHHDLGPLGSAVNTRALERQIEILQEMGCNAIRTAHNPPAPELLDLCDRMGMLVQVEAFDCWEKSKVKNDYARHFPLWHEKDLRAMVRRDRNHPCVVMWSTGNEVREMKVQADAPLSRKLTSIIKSEDMTRPVTFGCNAPQAGFNGMQKTVDLFGYNYKPFLYEGFRIMNERIPLYGSETASTVSSRGEYFFPVSDEKRMGQGGHFQVSSYDLTAPRWANNPDIEFAAQDKFPWVFGEFVWTGFDYIGEPTPYNKDTTNLLNFSDPEERSRMKEALEKLGENIPPRSSYFGIVDLCGFKKDRFYIYQARWRPELPMAHILPHWNWPERTGEVTPVHVYTSGDEAELFLNGKSLGRKVKAEYQYRLRWDDVVYEPGELKVVAYKNGKEWAEDVNKTTGKAVKVQLTADRANLEADGRDLSFITVQVSDEDGLLVPRSHNRIEFSIEGPGELVAVGNGDPTSHEPFQSMERKVFNGLALVIVRSEKGASGSIRLTASSEGLQPATIELNVN
jgi:beta-galactosidase